MEEHIFLYTKDSGFNPLQPAKIHRCQMGMMTAFNLRPWKTSISPSIQCQPKWANRLFLGNVVLCLFLLIKMTFSYFCAHLFF